ncbi:TPA: restriction endonuclease subunit S [Proteus mirabilis]|uniref:restriction endonuclease subunit S n=1 Tax=Proteus mirabilis TaxID=584 RepID=UPI0018C69C26|nr:restriction endonuclease subunit S [Proteus mirabilis]MBG3107004.1 restriction endonuclease subunit S [Proteus mirabilis]MEC3989288.1 restriction endonuclease subunit S [Proteus mirabilis]MEC4037616.1 restriction endonuclease subunit S [Proteus mirabilis]MEC4065807.1 restriction endonuclease subunit S [Proteus mirabilis]MEC4095613.1 restriction endonuclease subunit S [Proteus mirabilis]
MGNKVKLGELLSILTDYHANGAYKKLKENVELLDEPDFAVMIRTTNFEQEDFTNNLKYINKHAYSFLAKSKVYPNDIIMNKIANAGSSYLMPDLKVPVSLAMNLFLLRVDAAKANPIYIYLYLRVNEAYVKSFANGSVTKTITKDAVRNLEIELPSRSIQDRIAEQFICINNKITLNRQINQTLEQMAQTLFKSWFVDFDPVVDNALDAGFFEQDLAFSDELLRRVEVRKAVRESDNFKPLSEDIRRLFPNAFEECTEPALGLGGWVPKGWNNGCISDVAHYRTKRINTSELTLTNYISTENMLVDRKGIQKATALPTVNSVPAYTSGTILISNIRPYFKKIWLAKGDGGYSNDVLGFEVKDQGTEEYLFNLMYQDSFFDFMMATSKGSKMPRGDKKAILGLELVVPPLKLRKLFSKNVNGFYTSSSIRNNENHALGHLRDTLLPKLISGELSLSNIKIDIPEETLI